MYTILKNLTKPFSPSLESTIIVQFFLRDSLVRAPYATSFTHVQTFIRPAFKPSEIDDPLYKKLDFCSIIRYVYDSEKSDEAIFPFPRKHNYCAIFF